MIALFTRFLQGDADVEENVPEEAFAVANVSPAAFLVQEPVVPAVVVPKVEKLVCWVLVCVSLFWC